MLNLSFEEAFLKEVTAAIKPAFVQHQRAMVKEDIILWAVALRMHKVAVDDVAAAMYYWLTTSKFFPQPIEVIELAKGDSSGNRGLRAIGLLRSLIVNVGPYHQPKIEDPVLEHTIDDFGGWFKMCEIFTDDEFFQAKFLKAYANNQRALPVIGTSNQLALAIDDVGDGQTFSLGLENT